MVPAPVNAAGVTKTSVTDFQSVVFVEGAHVSFTALDACFADPSADSACPSLLYLKSKYLGTDQRAVYLQLSSTSDPFSDFAKTGNTLTGYTLHLAGAGTQNVDQTQRYGVFSCPVLLSWLTNPKE
jgi:hypothetical protein